MANKKNNKNKNNTRGRQMSLKTPVPVFNPRGSISTTVSKSDHDQVCALTNPFCPAARGSKIPDTDSSRSVAVTVTQTGFVPVAGSSTVCSGVFRAQPNIFFKPASTATVGATVDAWGSQQTIADFTTLQNTFSKFRIVSWGVRLWNQEAPLNRTGKIRVITTPEDIPNATSYVGSFFEEVHDLPIQQEHIYWISKPKGNAHLQYRTWTENLDDWDFMWFIADGVAATSGVSMAFEVVYNLECQVELNSVGGAMATAAAVYKPHVTSAASAVHSKMKSTHTHPGFMSQLATMAKSTLLDAAGAFMDRGLYALTGRRRQRLPVPQIVD